MKTDSLSLYEIACHFCVSHIPGASIPATRLSKILESILHERSLTPLALEYLQKKNLPGLYLLATGRISYQDYLSALDPALVDKEQCARKEYLAQEAAKKARQLETQRQHQAAIKARKEREAARKAELKQKQQTAETARLAWEAKWQLQSEKNRQAAEAAYKIRIQTPGYTEPTATEIAQYFRIRDPKALASPFSNILSALYQGRPLPEGYLPLLKLRSQQLHQLAIGQTTYESYILELERAEIALQQAEITRLEQIENQKRRREQAEAARIARESDPAYIARKKREEKCLKYGISYSEQLPEQLFLILEKLDSSTALSPDEFTWLISVGKRYYTQQVKRGYHRLEAQQCADNFKHTKDPWKAINGSAHYRKCDEPIEALDLLDQIVLPNASPAKLKSALSTTRGGVMRDLDRRTEAVSLGEQAHQLTPKDFRPCTLLGAVHMELGFYNLGHEWYQKAIERGATEKSVDSDIKRIYQQADKATREKMKAALLAEDPERFNWVKEKKHRKPR